MAPASSFTTKLSMRNASPERADEDCEAVVALCVPDESPADRLSTSSGRTSRPTMDRTSAPRSLAAPFITTVSITRPRRRTVVRVATSAISASLWVTRTTPQPRSATCRHIAKSPPTSRGGSTAVGSSSTSRRGESSRHFSTSTRCRSPTDRSSTGLSTSTSKA